jgi:hypothetical protein
MVSCKILCSQKVSLVRYFILCLFTAVCFFFHQMLDRADAGTITYQATNLADTTPGEDLWQYQYLLSGFGFALGSGFDIFFPLSEGYLFGDIQDTPPPNADWDTVALQPDPALPDDGRYDAVALVTNASLADAFIVDFVWRGTGTPGAQRFELFDDTFAVIERGSTTPIPEPGTLLLFTSGIAGLYCLRKRWVPPR